MTQPQTITKKVNLKIIRIDGGTQPRVSINLNAVAEYREAIRNLDDDLPPVIVFDDGMEYWLADGFHRWHAYNEEGRASIPAVVRPGTQRDAILYSVGANHAHGLRRSNEDKRNAVQTLLADAEWVMWSDSAIAKACAVSHTFVNGIRAAHLATLQDSRPTTRTVERNGTTYEQDTSNIGAGKPPKRPSGGFEAVAARFEEQHASGTEDDGGGGMSPEELFEAEQGAKDEAERIRLLLSDDVVAELNAKVEQQAYVIRTLKSRIHGLQAEKNQLDALVKSWRGKAERAERATH